MALAVDASSPAVVTGSTTTTTTAAFSPPASYIVAFCVADANNGNATETMTISSTGGLSWARVKNDNGNGGSCAEVWAATANTAPGSITVSATDSQGAVAKSIFVRVFTDTTVPAGIGATHVAQSGTTNAYTSTVNNSWGWGVGIGSGTPSVGGSETLDDTSTGGFDGGDSKWASHWTATTPTSGTTVTQTTGAGVVHWIVVEILPGAAAASGATAFPGQWLNTNSSPGLNGGIIEPIQPNFWMSERPFSSSVTATAGIADATGNAGLAPSVDIGITSTLPTGTGGAYWPWLSNIGALPGVATATGSGLAPVAAIGVTSTTATATGDGPSAPAANVTALPGVATATGVGLAPTIVVTQDVIATAGLATSTGIALAPTVSTVIDLTGLPGTFNAYQPVFSPGLFRSPNSPFIAGTASGVFFSVTVVAGIATATGDAALAPTPGVAESLPLATASGDAALAPQISIVATAGLATATGTGLAPLAGVAESLPLATATGTGLAPVVGIAAALPGVATAAGVGLAPSISVTVTLGLATATGVGLAPTVTVFVNTYSFPGAFVQQLSDAPGLFTGPSLTWTLPFVSVASLSNFPCQNFTTTVTVVLYSATVTQPMDSATVTQPMDAATVGVVDHSGTAANCGR